MKRGITFFLIVSTIFLTTCKKDYDYINSTEMLSGSSWHLTDATLEDTEVGIRDLLSEVESCGHNDILTFNENGECKMDKNSGCEYIYGTWKLRKEATHTSFSNNYKTDKVLIIKKDKKEYIYLIVKLNSTNLELKLKGESSSYSTLIEKYSRL